MKVNKILKTKNVISVSPQDTLSSALKHLSSSHDSAFVLEKDKLVGIVNPYYSLIKKSFPANAKVANALMHPPKLTEQTSLTKAAKLMIESKLHYLPVLKGEKFIGIATARRIMRHHLDADTMKTSIQKVLNKKNKLETVKENDYLSAALQLFKTKKISKLVVTNGSGKLAGILAYYDIIDYLTEPRQKPRVASKGKKSPVLKKPVKNFQKKHVLTLTPEHTLKDAAKMILDKNIGSVIVVDKAKKPIGIITTQDILKELMKRTKPVLAKLHGHGLSTSSKKKAESFATSMSRLLSRTKSSKKAEITIKEKKNGGVFEAVISVVGLDKKGFIVRGEDKDLSEVLKDVRKKVRRLIKR